MAGLHKSGDSDVRASDHDRNEVAALLRVHCVEGRITLEELERRVERAMSAPTVGQLAEVLSDLPAVEVVAGQLDRPGSVRVGPPGVRPFTLRIVVPAAIERTRAVALDTIAPGLNAMSYELKRQSPTGLEFERNAKERIVIAFERSGSRRTTMIIHGRASRTVRKKFAKFAVS
jgi:Domain of unknown function (DUF1707)